MGVLGLFAGTVGAAEGYYIGFGSVRTDFEVTHADVDAAFPTEAGSTAQATAVDTSAKGYEIVVGQRLTDNLIIEASLFSLGELDFSGAVVGDNGAYEGAAEPAGVGVTFLGVMPFRRNFSLFAEAGWHHTKSDLRYNYSGDSGVRVTSSTETQTGVLAGLGLEIRVGTHTALRWRIRDYYDIIGPFEWSARATTLGLTYNY